MIEFKPIAAIPMMPQRRPRGNPGPIVGDEYPSVTVSSTTFYAWFEFQMSHEYDLELELVSELPDLGWGEYGHWFDYEREMCGWDFLPGFELNWQDDFQMVKMALTLGVAPNQPFLMKVFGAYSTSRDWESGHEEAELECDWELISIEKLAPTAVLEEWRIWHAQMRMLDKETREGGIPEWMTGPIALL